jgi:hypothetical protein
MENLSSGIIAHKKPGRVTNVLAHGPGIKLMNGLAEASTNGNTIYAYRCRGEVLYTSRSGLVPANTKFLPVMALAGSTNEK